MIASSVQFNPASKAAGFREVDAPKREVVHFGAEGS
jgi:hypothetical protein